MAHHHLLRDGFRNAVLVPGLSAVGRAFCRTKRSLLFPFIASDLLIEAHSSTYKSACQWIFSGTFYHTFFCPGYAWLKPSRYWEVSRLYCPLHPTCTLFVPCPCFWILPQPLHSFLVFGDIRPGTIPSAILFAKGRKLSKILLQQYFPDSVNISRSYCKQKVPVLQVFGQVAGNITKAGHINCVLSAF